MSTSEEFSLYRRTNILERRYNNLRWFSFVQMLIIALLLTTLLILWGRCA